MYAVERTIPFLYEVTLDQNLAWCPPRDGVSVLVDNFGGDMWEDLSYGFNSLDDCIGRSSLERHGAA